MSAPKNNEFYLKRLKHGRKKIFESPEKLKRACYKYFKEATENPLQEEKVFGTGKRMTVDKMRPFTLKGMFVYLGIDHKTWQNYRDREEYKEAIEEIENIIYDQKFSGAAAGLLNPVIISRELGLAEQMKFNLEDLTDDQIDQLFNKHVLNNKQ